MAVFVTPLNKTFIYNLFLKFVNNMKKLIFTFGVIIACMTAASAQTSTKEYVEIKTSAVCGMCKATIEKALDNVDGIKSASLDVDSKVVSIKYDGTVTNVESIKTAITMAGYSADEVPANKEAYDKLHGCCKAEHD